MSASLSLREWRRYTPDDTPRLRGLTLDGPGARRDAQMLTGAGRLSIVELRSGLQIETNAWVGRVRLGALQVSIAPKLDGLPLLRLLRYAYGLRDLELHAPPDYALGLGGLDDLLIRQLRAEAEELVSRGLGRRYVERRERLGSPRGRFDLNAFARRGGIAEARLPCIHHPLSEDQPVNRILRAGLWMAARETSDPELAMSLRCLHARMEGVTPMALSVAALEEVRWSMSRLDRAYEAAFCLIDLLIQGQGPTLSPETGERARLPGILFDMNLFFQRLLGRFLREHLAGLTLREEHSLRGVLCYAADANPLRRTPPTPRPDFAVERGGKILQILDAKYRDLWHRPLPRDMLYQLALYAASRGQGGEAVILYPTLAQGALESRLEVRDPTDGARRATVILRPVNMLGLAEALETPSVVGQRARSALARALVFGERSVGIGATSSLGWSARGGLEAGPG